MSHLVEEMAYVGRTPWHGLGNELDSGQPLEVWARQAGLNWSIEESPVQFPVVTGDGQQELQSVPGSKVLYRSDNQAPLSVVGDRFKVVQPEAILEFYRDLTKSPALSWKRPAHSRAGASSGHWPAQGSPPR